MNTKKILTALFAGVVALSALSTASMAQEESTVSTWDGTSYSLDWLSTGDPEKNAGDEFYLNSAADLAGLAYYVNNYASTNNIFTGDTVYLNVDVDLAKFDWDPIGTAVPREKNRFYGSFNGQGHTISNLKVAEGHYFAGLFGQIPTYTYTQTFSNVTINNANVVAADETESGKSKEAAGALIGRANGTVIDNCHVTGEVYISGDRFVGGLLGHSYAQIEDCSVTATGTINADTWQAGGLVGAHGATATYTASIENCVVDGGEEGLAVTSYYAAAGGAIGSVSVSGVDTTPIDGITVNNVSVEAEDDSNGAGVALVASGYTATNSVATKVETTVNEVSVPAVDAEATKAVAQVGRVIYTDFVEALKAIESGSVITLLDDITIDYRWDCRNYGSTACYGMTKVPYTFDGNGHTLKFTGKIDDGGNYYAVFRPEAATTFKNLTVDMSEAISVFQNRFSVISSKTEALTVEKCIFIGSTTHTNARAIIFGEGGNSETLAETEIVVTGCEFENWKNGVVDNMNGADVASVTVTGSEFTNAGVTISASESITFNENVMDNGSVNITSYTADTELAVEMKGNTLDETADNKIQKCATFDTDETEDIILPNFTVNGVKYSSFANALNVAGENDVIVIAPGTYNETLNINKSVVITGDPNYGADAALAAVTEKPVINISTVTNGGVQYHAPNVVFDNLVFNVLEDATGAGWNVSALGYYYENTADRNGLTVTNCDFINNSDISMSAIAANIATYTITDNTFKNFTTMVHSFVDHGALGKVVVSDNSFANVENIVSVYWGAENEAATIEVANNKSTDGSVAKIIIDDFGKTKATPVTAIPAATISGNDAELSLLNYDEDSNNYTIADNAADPTYSYATEEIMRTMDGNLPDGVVYVAYGTDKEQMFIVVDGKVKTEVETVSLVFRANTDDEYKDELENAVWDMYLVASDSEIINRLNSADFTFELTTDEEKDAMAYEIIATNDEIVINNVNNEDNRYEFHYDGKDDTTTDTALEIKIGTVKFTGYGPFVFAVDTTDVAENTNTVHTTTFVDNIVDSFIVGGVADEDGNVTNELKVDSNIDSEIIVPTQKLTINVDFPNSVSDNAATYQQMKVTVSGGDLEKALTIDLGTDYVISDYSAATYDNKKDVAVNVSELYKIEIANLLTINNTYTVTVEGAGYRTARYNVTMTEDKILNFWNNVKDNAVNIEEKKDSSAKNVTFLAGDIVNDNNINIYDLSAVVSYFGEIDLVANNMVKYAKYDLNRDGKIDSKDVAYVLVSWGK